jgi:hypothetical protein
MVRLSLSVSLPRLAIGSHLECGRRLEGWRWARQWSGGRHIYMGREREGDRELITRKFDDAPAIPLRVFFSLRGPSCAFSILLRSLTTASPPVKPFSLPTPFYNLGSILKPMAFHLLPPVATFSHFLLRCASCVPWSQLCLVSR